MRQRIATTIITLSLLLGLALWSAVRGVKAQASTYPLNPNSFTSLGASPFNVAGAYTIDASKNNAAPTLSGPGIASPIAGVFYSPSNGAVARDEIAVFTFNFINIPAGVTVKGAQNANSRPIALLSQSTATIDGTIDVSGANGTDGVDVFEPAIAKGGDGGNAGPGGGGGAGGPGVGPRGSAPGNGGLGFVNGESGVSLGYGGSVEPGGGGQTGANNIPGVGGAFGGNGDDPLNTTSRGGKAYGDLSLRLQGGSGGGGGAYQNTPGACDLDECNPDHFESGGGGGGGGGAVEIGATGNISLGGLVLANGGAGGLFGGGTTTLSGGGAGGGIFVHAPMVSLSGNLNTIGGRGVGGGGGGRVLILTADGTLASGSLATNVNANAGGTGSGTGGHGSKDISPAKLGFTQQPTSTAGTTLSPVVVQVQDVRGNQVTNNTLPVTLALGNNPSGATLGGTLTVNAVGGIATFNNLTVNKPGADYTLIASSGVLISATSNAFDITCQAITVSPAAGALPAGTVGSTYSQQFTQTGGNGTITWSISPAIPGLSIDATGKLSGTPTQAGNYSFTITATDGQGCPGSTSYTLALNCPTLGLTPSTLPAGTVGVAYQTTTLLPTGGAAPYSITVSGLPGGLSATTTSTSVTLSGAPTQAGSFTLRVDLSDAYGCARSGVNYPLTIAKGTPVLTWNNPADIIYGTALSNLQLNATANVSGSFAYTPATGTVLNAGSGQILSVLFTPANSANYNSATHTVTLNVLKATPIITWNLPAFFPEGSQLSAANLNATANVPGTFSYTPPAGTVLTGGLLTLTASFTPTDTANYNLTSLSVTVPVYYNFSGFFQPVDNAPTVNSVNAGQAIPVKFSLSGNKGLNIFAAGYPVSQQVACSSGTPTNDIEQTVTAGGSSLSYDAASDTYTYVWKTDQAWKGTCRQLIVRLNDGTDHIAHFKFK